jgi:hypothetical protein
MTTYEMNPSLREDILRAIEFNYNGIYKKGSYINDIECPSCEKKEAFTNHNNPWVIKCGRSNNCGESHHAKDLFKHLFESWTERYEPKTEAEKLKNPTAVADGYLKDGRGFDLINVRGWYTQEYFFKSDINEGSTTVRFPMPNGYWERVLDKPQRFGKQKARIVGSNKGLVWQAPIFSLKELSECDEIYITEGIFDAISWIHAGKVAVSNLSSGNYPNIFLANLLKQCPQGKRPTLVWAQDGDRAGSKAILKFVALAEKDGWTCRAAQPPAERNNYDWNDLHQLKRMGEKDIDLYLHLGDLLLAPNASEKALLMYTRQERREFWFTYDSRLYWFKLDMDAYDREVQSFEIPESGLTPAQREQALKRAGMVTCICNAIPMPLYFQSNYVTDESWYYFSIESQDGKITKQPFTPKQLTSSNEFKNRLLSTKNSWWTGSGKQLDRLMQDMMHNLKSVETIDYIGYSKEHKTFIYNEVAIRDGRINKINDEDYFEFGRLSIKSLAKSPELNINTSEKEYDPSWSQHVVEAFGTAGTIATAYWLGSLFCEQIRAAHKSYPFFELVGQAGAGKSTLLEFLWKLYGREDWEGEDPQKATVAARSRMFNQVSGLPVVLIESDREATDGMKAKQFDWDDLKTAYNGRAMRSRGVKNNGNDTYAPPFRGSIVISQNEAVQASEAILSRICHITVTREHQTKDTKTHAEWLERVPTNTVSGFLLRAAAKEKDLMSTFNTQAEIHEAKLLNNPEVRMIRIAKTHSQLMALVDCCGDMGLKLFTEQQCNEAKLFLEGMAASRQRVMNNDHPVVQEFWEAYDYIEATSKEPRLNHYGIDDSRIAINLKEFERWCGEYKLKVAESRILKQFLRTSKNRKFVDSNLAVRSQIDMQKTTKCWTFHNGKAGSTVKGIAA